MVDVFDIAEPQFITWTWFSVPYPCNGDIVDIIDLSLGELHVNIAAALNSIDIATKVHVMICISKLENLSEILITNRRKQSTMDFEITADDVEVLMMLISSIGFASIGIPVSYEVFKLMEKAQKLFHTKAIINSLLKEFKDHDIRVFSNLEIDGLESIDIFISIQVL